MLAPPSSAPTLMHALGTRAKASARQIATAPSAAKDLALTAAADALLARKASLLDANAREVSRARESGLSTALCDRLTLTEARIEAMHASLCAIALLPDPVGRELARFTRPNGLVITRRAVPLGVIGVIYESRPNVTADAGALCLKSGNAVILRSGSECIESARLIAECLRVGLGVAGLPEDVVQLVADPDRKHVSEMLQLTDFIDVIIPRGGTSLTERVRNESRVATLLHLDGNCHTYVHAAAEPGMAREIVLNAKMRRTSVCGATETLLIDEAALPMLPALADALLNAGCALRGDEAAQSADSRIAPASDRDWSTEYLDAILAIKTVNGVAEAIDHINRYGSHHTDAIVTDDAAAAARFLTEVDSAIVMHNASTQFADGGEFGFGAEIGIATGRLHARGPVGLEQLTTYQYQVQGGGQVRPF